MKGISLFIVPKFLVNEDGSLGARNDVQLRVASSTSSASTPARPRDGVRRQGRRDRLLVGEENRGLEYMFIMMNAARLAVGLEGFALAERAFQHALAYARERVQGSRLGVEERRRWPIIRHPDVRRMLMPMKSRTEAMRARRLVVAASTRPRAAPSRRGAARSGARPSST